MKRRSFLVGIFEAASAPAIVRASSLMVLPSQKIITGWPAIDPTVGKSGQVLMMTGTTTGRISSSQPQWQELPRNSPIQGSAVDMIRRWKAEEQQRYLESGRLMDFSNLEWRTDHVG